MNGFLRSRLSGESECSRLEGVLGVRNKVGVLKLDDAAEQVMKRPLALDCVCQVRLKTVLLYRCKTLMNSKENG